ncbi:MAG: hypothetical protein KDD69_08495 [Bdellovibrionales bacterium]|nr:hypothetical protein [Bdellovibrionales bacterium]
MQPSVRPVSSGLLLNLCYSLAGLFGLAVLLAGPLASEAVADPSGGSQPRYGRLADGRAYRIDAQGLRLVDQMAELEVTVEELRREMRKLEGELVERDGIISRLKEGKTSADAAAAQPLPPARASNTEAPDCNELVSSLYLKTATLERELRETKQQLGEQAVKRSAAQPLDARCDYDSPANPLWAQVERLQQELMKGPTRENYVEQVAEADTLGREVQTLKESLTKQQQENERLAAELSAQGGLLSRLTAENDDLRAQAASRASLAREQPALDAEGAAPEQQAQPSTAAATDRIESASSAPEVAASEQSEPSAEPSSPTARNLQRKFHSELAAIQGLIMERKNLLDRSRGSHSPQPLVTANGTSLDRLREEIAALSWTSNSASIEDGLNEIKQLLKEDIAALRRVR